MERIDLSGAMWMLFLGGLLIGSGLVLALWGLTSWLAW